MGGDGNGQPVGAGGGDQAVVVGEERAAAFAEGERGGEMDGVERAQAGVWQRRGRAADRGVDLDQLHAADQGSRGVERERVRAPRGPRALDLEQRGRGLSGPRFERGVESCRFGLVLDELHERRGV
jgi:hypothetical protein